jgi:hypothetical protein
MTLTWHKWPDDRPANGEEVVLLNKSPYSGSIFRSTAFMDEEGFLRYADNSHMCSTLSKNVYWALPEVFQEIIDAETLDNVEFVSCHKWPEKKPPYPSELIVALIYRDRLVYRFISFDKEGVCRLSNGREQVVENLPNSFYWAELNIPPELI